MKISTHLIKMQMVKSVFVKLFVGVWLVLLAFPANASMLLQNSFVTINVKNVSVKEFLTEVQKLSKLDIVYMSADLTENKTITYSCSNKNVSKVLDETLKSLNLSYKVENQTIVIYKEGTASKVTIPVVVQQPTNAKIEISGKIVDEQRKPIAGATVIIKNDATGAGAISNESGAFVLRARVGDILDISCVGMLAVEHKIVASKTKDLVIEMKSDLMEVGNVVVTGIFNKAKESYTGSVTTVTAKDLKHFKGQNVLSTLRNIDPALNIVQNNEFGSNPNLLPEVNIRGNSSLPGSLQDLEQGAKAQLNAPLVIMDGFEVSLQKLMDFNDEDIEQINILKDASATAIYGSRGANGVIVIITKAPKAGKLRVFAQVGINIEMPDLTSYDLLNAREKLEFEKNIGLYSTSEYGTPWNNPMMRTASEQYNAIYRDVMSGVDTYWLSQPLRTGLGQKYNARLEGGSNEFRWSVSLGYNENIGVMKNSNRNTFDGTINLSYKYKNLLFKNQTSVSTSRGDDSNYGTFSDYTKMNPYWRIYDLDGKMIKEYRNNSQYSPVRTSNPLYDAQFTQINSNNNTDLVNNFSLEWNVTDDFTVKGRLGISKNFNSSDKFRYSEDTEFINYSEEDYLRRGSYKYNTGQGFNYDGSITLNYSKNINDKHQIYVGLDGSLSQKDSYSYGFSMQGFNDEYFNFLANAAFYQKDGKPSGSEAITRLASLVGNVNYTFLNRYYFDLAYRYDGSSQFGSKNKFAPFWSAGIGWNLHQENFLKDVEMIDRLRIKGSYGVTGSQQFSPYKAIASYTYNISDRYMMWNSASFMGLGNENLKWQNTNQLSGGIELTLFESRITASFEAYHKLTDNLLSEMDLPLASGFASFTDNVGEVKSKGYEAMLSGYLVRDTKRNITWSVTGKLAYNKNYISKLSDAIKVQTQTALNKNVELNNLLYEGHSQSSIYAVPSLGIDPSTGVELYLDKNGNPTYDWNANAKVLAGIAEPKFRGNLSTMFIYKNLSLNLSFGYHWGGQQYNNTVADRIEISRNQAFHNVDRRVSQDRWMEPGDMTPYKGFYKLNGAIADRSKASSRFVENDNMFSLQSANLQYSWRSKWVKENLKMEYVNMSINTSDLFYISTIKRERGLSYPFARRVSLALSLTF